jgi:hypothetical protein
VKNVSQKIENQSKILFDMKAILERMQAIINMRRISSIDEKS